MTYKIEPMTAKQFTDFCRKHDACLKGLRTIKGKSLRKWWLTTKHGGYMLWFCLMYYKWKVFKQIFQRLRVEAGSAYLLFGSRTDFARQAKWLRENVKVSK